MENHMHNILSKRVKWAFAAIALTLLCAFAPICTAHADETVSVDFDANGVAGVVHTETGNGSVIVPEIELNFEGYEFTGEWNTTRWGTGDAYVAGDEVTESTTLYAQWEDGTHLFEAAETASLDEAIDVAEGVDTSLYTESSVKALMEALEAAKAVAGSDDTEQPEADEALQALSDALDALKVPADTEDLEAVIEKADVLDLSQYTDESAQAVRDALKAAQSLADGEATEDMQGEVDAAAKALNDALDALEEKSLIEKAVSSVADVVSGEESSSTDKDSVDNSTSEKDVDSGSTYGKTGGSDMALAIAIVSLGALGAICGGYAIHNRRKEEI